MRHQVSGRKLNRSSGHRVALFRNLVVALIRHGKIRTTDAKAKELRSFADQAVTLGKQGSLHAKRRAFDRIRDEEAVTKLFGVIAPGFANRAGGYTRVTKLGVRRGDAAPLSIVEWTTEKEAPGKKKPKKRGEAKAKGHDHKHAPGEKHDHGKKRAAAG
jgi:large subunit ribosomal protein L17